MWFKRNRKLLGKIVLLLVMLLVIMSGLGVLGCAGIKGVPEGGSGVAIANGTLYLCPAITQGGGFGCSAPSGEAKLVVLNTAGAHLWETPLETEKATGGWFSCAQPPKPVAIYGTPAVVRGLVYIGSYSGKIYAINSSSGALRWVYPRQDKLEPIIGDITVAGDRLYFGCSDGKVYALDAATGDKEWEFQTGDKIWSTPVIDGDRLFIGSFDKKLYALSVTDGSKEWEFAAEGTIAATPLVYDNTVYIGSFDRHLYAVNASDGNLKWKFPAERWFWTKPVAYDNTIYAGCFDGKVYALNAESGNKVAELDMGSPVSAWPVIVDSSIIFASEEGKVYSVDTATNQMKQIANIEEKIYTPLCATDGVIYIYSEAQNLYALNAESGVRLWTLPITSK